MKRDEFLKSIIGLSAILLADQGCTSTDHPKKKKVSDNPPLLPFSGNFDAIHTAHLLRRTTFGFTREQLQKCMQLGLNQTIDLLFEKHPRPAPPINFEFKNDPYTPLNKTWIHSPYLKKTFFEQYRKKSLQSWSMEVIHNEPISIREQLTLFWHNHFGVSDVVEHKFEYIHISLLRKYAWSNFRELVKKVTIDPAMLRFLSGFENTKKSPNENYARELLELFTIGKGPLIAEGDYTTYTEKDVRAISKILTGWTDTGWYSFYKEKPIGAVFSSKRHNKEPIYLSDKFDDVQIPPLFNKRYEYLIDMIFKKEEVAYFITRKLYRWFVHSNIDEVIEKQVITPLAQQLIANNYEIQPVLYTLLKSDHFFQQKTTAPKVKNPLEYIFGLLRYFPFELPADNYFRNNFWHQIFQSATAMGMEYFKPPSVAGWKAYYQEPLYYNTWINAATLQSRKIFSDNFIKNGFPFENSTIKLDLFQLISSLSDLTTTDVVIDHFNSVFFIEPFTLEQRTTMRDILIEGLNEKNWQPAILKYIKNGQPDSENIIEQNYTAFLIHLFSLPEYHIA